jgi:hypothetical protein
MFGLCSFIVACIMGTVWFMFMYFQSRLFVLYFCFVLVFVLFLFGNVGLDCN